MNNKLKKEMVERWTDEMNFKINAMFKKEDWRDKNIINARWNMAPFGSTDNNKLDFRGFVFREPIHYHYISNIDFSYSRVISGNKDNYGPSRGVTGFISSILEDCNFIGSQMPANLAEKFTKCNFSGAKFESSKLNADFFSCQFINSNMKDVLANGKKFIKCDFTNASLKKCNFYNCYFEDCIFDNAIMSSSNISGSTFVKTKPSELQIMSCSVSDNLKFL